MSTLTAPDIPPDADGPAQRLRRTAAAVRCIYAEEIDLTALGTPTIRRASA